ncbi:hypothetical protein OROGR_028545 [Orobanche gracilis]
MEPPLPLPASATTAAATSPRPPIVPARLRLMCSYGGHIVPRPHDKSLFYAGGETRIVAVDRRTIGASLSALSAHLSRGLFNNRPFHLKYQIPNEDLDSLISVITDEDLSNMLEEHDRIAPPARIRLFLFPIKPESIGSALLDPKSETWFSDALRSTGILQKGQSADSALMTDIGPDLEAPVEGGSNSGGGGGEGKLGAESLVLETSSSFGSTSSSLSMSNSPPIGVNQCDEKGLNLLDTSIKVPASASIQSEVRVASLSSQPKLGILQEQLIQVDPGEPSENPFSDRSLNVTTQNPVQVFGYPLSQLPDGKKQPPETQLIQGGLHYISQYPGPVPIPPYYPLYQMPMHPQHISPSNQPYPIYLVPVRPSQYPNMSTPYNPDANTTSSSVLPPWHPQTASITHPVPAPKEVYGAQVVSIPCNQGQVVVGPPDVQISSGPITNGSAGSEFDEDIVYNQIYKSQPLPPLVPTLTKGTTIVMEPSIQMQQ